MATDNGLGGMEAAMFPGTLQGQLAALRDDPAVQRLRASRQCLADDPCRPLYHFSAPENVMNDPNGLCQWRGRYHLFYQFKPDGATRMTWGHAVSEDLFHWRDLPIAVFPDSEKDCYSGQTLVEADRVIAVYHGTRAGNCIATADDPLLLNWQKHPANPVIPTVAAEENGAPYRVFDPCIWREEDGYYTLSGVYKDGTQLIDCRNVEHLFRSQDLADWEHLGPLIEDGFYTEPGEDGAVPNFLPIGNEKHLLLFFSHKRGGQYYIGRYDRAAHRFTPDSHGRMNYGPVAVGSLHAPSATVDDGGRLLAIFNVKEARNQPRWRDVMTLPRILSLDKDNSLCVVPAEEAEALRFGHVHVDRVQIPANGESPLPSVRGAAMEIQATIEPGEAREVGLLVLRCPDGAEQTRISLYRGGHHRFPDMHALQIDVSAASLASDVRARPPEVGPLRLHEGEPLRLQIFVDRSIVEVFANDRQCLTVRVYPQREDSTGVSLFARGNAAELVSLDAWQMRSVWPELAHREGR